MKQKIYQQGIIFSQGEETFVHSTNSEGHLFVRVMAIAGFLSYVVIINVLKISAV
jgi:hypothetical protein